ncbi:hypothetical protein [Streptomyces corynorhini]|uniref:hypothetical protein n=1 Tax=Streptomyces corynorhini TaxID=2282652 RepID=UPI001F32ADB5|nr:hypothetical protein [Streptomyces corynorhini]
MPLGVTLTGALTLGPLFFRQSRGRRATAGPLFVRAVTAAGTWLTLLLVSALRARGSLLLPQPAFHPHRQQAAARVAGEAHRPADGQAHERQSRP